jgi:hypothetical protein
MTLNLVTEVISNKTRHVHFCRGEPKVLWFAHVYTIAKEDFRHIAYKI